MVNNDSYITIQAFMINDLNLKGNELLVYAIIFGYSQDGQSQFQGSIQYLANWTNSTKRSIINNLKTLQKKELILKEEIFYNNLKFCKYRVNLSYRLSSENSSPQVKDKAKGSEKSSIGVVKKVPLGSEKSSPNNIGIYSSNNIIDNRKHKNHNVFQKPTIEELKIYCLERKNNIDSEKFFDYYESNGWKVGKNSMKDWKASVRTWERNQKPQQPYTQNKHDFKETLTEEDYAKYDR